MKSTWKYWSEGTQMLESIPTLLWERKLLAAFLEHKKALVHLEIDF